LRDLEKEKRKDKAKEKKKKTRRKKEGTIRGDLGEEYNSKPHKGLRVKCEDCREGEDEGDTVEHLGEVNRGNVVGLVTQHDPVVPHNKASKRGQRDQVREYGNRKAVQVLRRERQEGEEHIDES